MGTFKMVFISIQFYLYFTCMSQALLRLNKKLGNLGSHGDGVSGSATKQGRFNIFSKFRSVLKSIGQSEPYEFVDVGAGDGIMVCLALCFGATFSVGIEVKDGQEAVFKSYLPLLLEYGDDDLYCSAFIDYGTSTTFLDVLPTYQCDGEFLPRCVFFFCDGWSQADREHVFEILIGRDPLIHVVICSPGRGMGDWFTTPDDILEVLNASDVISKFIFDSKLKVKMSGSRYSKSLFVFKRVQPV